MATVAAAAMAMVTAADNNERSSGEAVTMAGNGGSRGDRCRAGCEGRESEVIKAEAVAQVDGRWQRCSQMGGSNATRGNTTTSQRKIGGQGEGCWRMR